MTVSLECNTNRIEKGQKMNVALIIQNQSIFPIAKALLALQYRNAFAEKAEKKRILSFADAKSSQRVQCSFLAKHFGKIEVYSESIKIYDYFRIFSVSKKINCYCASLVLPDIHAMAVNEKAFDEGGEESELFSQEKAGEDPTEVFSIREYQEGDKQHRIHWKLSSKRKKYMVKEFSLPIIKNEVILIDFYQEKTEKSPYDFTDGLLEKTISLSSALQKKGRSHKLVWYDKSLETIQSYFVTTEKEFYEAIEALVCASLYEEKEIFAKAFGIIETIDNIHNVYYVGEGSIEGFKAYGITPKRIA